MGQHHENRFKTAEVNGFEVARQEIERFVHNDGLTELAAMYGHDDLPADTDSRLEALLAIAKAWDYRHGAERYQINWAGHDKALARRDPHARRTIIAASGRLGMVGASRPKVKHPDYLAVMGAANGISAKSLRYGLEVVDAPRKAIVYLGSSRLLTDTERASHPDIATEFDLGCWALESILGATKIDDHVEPKGDDVWRGRTYEYERDGDVGVAVAICAMRQDGAPRANTYDNFAALAEWADLANNASDSVVAVTASPYVPGQRFPGLLELTAKHGVHCETIGHKAARPMASLLLQETKAAIDAAHNLDTNLRVAA